MYEPTALTLAEVKMLLGIAADDTSKDDLLNIYITRAGQMLLNRTRQASLPDDLLPVLTELSVDAYTLGLQQAGSEAGVIASVSDNGQSVSFRDGVGDKVLVNLAESIKAYESQIQRWSVPGW